MAYSTAQLRMMLAVAEEQEQLDRRLDTAYEIRRYTAACEDAFHDMTEAQHEKFTCWSAMQLSRFAEVSEVIEQAFEAVSQAQPTASVESFSLRCRDDDDAFTARGQRSQEEAEAYLESHMARFTARFPDWVTVLGLDEGQRQAAIEVRLRNAFEEHRTQLVELCHAHWARVDEFESTFVQTLTAAEENLPEEEEGIKNEFAADTKPGPVEGKSPSAKRSRLT